MPQSLQVSFGSVSTTNTQIAGFSVPGNQTGTFSPGTAVQATINVGNIYGIVQSSSYGGTPGTTTVTVFWFSTALNTTVTAVATGILTAQGVGSALPLIPTVPITGSTVFTYASLFQTYVIDGITGAVTLTMPAASSVPPGSWLKIRNTHVSIDAYYVQFSGTIDGVINPYMLGLDWTVWSDGTNWHTSVAPTQVVDIAYSSSANLLSAGGQTTWTSLATALQGLVPAAARAIFGYGQMVTGGTGYLAPAATASGALSTGSGLMAIGALTMTPWRMSLAQAQLAYYLVTADTMNIWLAGYEL